MAISWQNPTPGQDYTPPVGTTPPFLQNDSEWAIAFYTTNKRWPTFNEYKYTISKYGKVPDFDEKGVPRPAYLADDTEWAEQHRTSNQAWPTYDLYVQKATQSHGRPTRDIGGTKLANLHVDGRAYDLNAPPPAGDNTNGKPHGDPPPGPGGSGGSDDDDDDDDDDVDNVDGGDDVAYSGVFQGSNPFLKGLDFEYLNGRLNTDGPSKLVQGLVSNYNRNATSKISNPYGSFLEGLAPDLENIMTLQGLSGQGYPGQQPNTEGIGKYLARRGIKAGNTSDPEYNPLVGSPGYFPGESRSLSRSKSMLDPAYQALYNGQIERAGLNADQGAFLSDDVLQKDTVKSALMQSGSPVLRRGLNSYIDRMYNDFNTTGGIGAPGGNASSFFQFAKAMGLF